MKKRIPYIAITGFVSTLLPFLFLFLSCIRFDDQSLGSGYDIIFGSTSNNILGWKFLPSPGLLAAFIINTAGSLIMLATLVHMITFPEKNPKINFVLEIISSIFFLVSGILFIIGKLFINIPEIIHIEVHTGIGLILSGFFLLVAFILLLYDILLQTKAKEFAKSSTGGMLIGVACLIPGVSGGTVAVMVGIYKKLVSSVGNLFKKFKSSFLYLLPIAIGAIIAIIVCWYPFDILMEEAMLAIVGLFAGLVIGGIPSIFKNIKGVKPKASGIIGSILASVLAVAIGIASVLISHFTNENIVESMFTNFDWYLYPIIVLIGILAAIALVVPGISGSLVLLVLGFYKPILGLINNFKSGEHIGETFGVLGLFVVGVIIGFFSFSKLMNYLLDKHHDTTYFVIIGFIIGSVVAIFINNSMIEYIEQMISVNSYWEWIVSPILLIAGVVLTYFLMKYADKKQILESNSEE